MTVNLKVDDLGPAAQSLAHAAEQIGNAPLPGVPDAGPSSAAIAATMAALTSAMSAAANGCAQGADAVQAAAKAYQQTEGNNAHNVRSAGPGGGH